MAIILNIETATTNCSVSIAKEGKTLALREHDTPNYSHSEQLHVFIKEMVEETDISFSDLEAIAVSKGPGSYTGLRIGVSAAKGLCFSLDIPLIAIPTLQSMAFQAKPQDARYIIPVLDARRMEVYSAVFDYRGEEIRETKAEIIDENSFAGYLKKGKVLLMGSGAKKCEEILSDQNLSIDSSVAPSAKEMALLSHKRFIAGNFEDIAYFEPYYLKDFIATKAAKK